MQVCRIPRLPASSSRRIHLHRLPTKKAKLPAFSAPTFCSEKSQSQSACSLLHLPVISVDAPRGPEFGPPFRDSFCMVAFEIDRVVTRLKAHRQVSFRAPLPRSNILKQPPFCVFFHHCSPNLLEKPISNSIQPAPCRRHTRS